MIALGIFIALIGIGIIIAFNPLLLTLEVALLSRKRPHMERVIYFIAGMFTPLVILAIAGFFFLGPQVSEALLQNETTQVTLHWIDLVIGISLIIGGTRYLLTSFQRSPDKKPRQPFIMKSSALLYSFGFARMLTNVTSLAALFLALRLIQDFIPTIYLQIVALIWLLFISILPYIGLMIIKNSRPKKFYVFKRLFNKLNVLTDERVVGITSIGVGVILVIIAIVLFVS